MESKKYDTKSMPPTGQAIPKTSFIDKFFLYIERVTGKKSLTSFILQGIIFNFLYWIPTIFASILRGKLYKLVLGKIGNGCLIEKHVRIAIPSQIFLGDRVYIGEFSYLDPKTPKAKIILGNDVYISRLCRISGGAIKDFSGEVLLEDSVYVGQNGYIDGSGKLKIGKGTLIGPNVVLIPVDHQFRDPETPIRFQGGVPKVITIGEDVWLGANVTIVGGVTIEKGSVIAAGSVVTKDIPPYSIAAGIPAKVISKRG